MEELKINSTYTSSKLKQEISDFFETQGFVQLTSFFEDCNIKIDEKKFDKIFKPLEKKRSELNLKNIYDFETIRFVEYFRSKKFLSYIEDLTGFELSFNSLEVISYKKGDYLILNDNQKREEVIEVVFDLSDELQDGFGGVQVYTTKEEEVLYLEPHYNVLTILYKPEEVMKYVKYLNNKCENKKIVRFIINFDLEEA